MASFFYDGEKGVRNFTSITGERPDLSFLPFPIDKVAVLECCNGLVLCLCVEAAGSRYVVCNLGTKNLQVLPPSIHAVGQARLGFDPTASSHFHVIEFVEEEDAEYQVWISTHLKLQLGSIRNLNGARTLMM